MTKASYILAGARRYREQASAGEGSRQPATHYLDAARKFREGAGSAPEQSDQAGGSTTAANTALRPHSETTGAVRDSREPPLRAAMIWQRWPLRYRVVGVVALGAVVAVGSWWLLTRSTESRATQGAAHGAAGKTGAPTASSDDPDPAQVAHGAAMSVSDARAPEAGRSTADAGLLFPKPATSELESRQSTPAQPVEQPVSSPSRAQRARQKTAGPVRQQRQSVAHEKPRVAEVVVRGEPFPCTLLFPDAGAFQTPILDHDISKRH